MYEGKRILIAQPIIRGYNGSTMVTFELAKYLQSLGMDVTIYTCDHADPAKSYFKKNKLKVDGSATIIYDNIKKIIDRK